ncbi:hypothetical protein LTR95_011842 [Oleoguttula sp. CCFEE 5521]
MAAPPPAKQISNRMAKGFTKLAQDQERMKKIRENSAASVFFDKDAPSTRARRLVARSNFEGFVTATFDKTEIAEMWDVATFTDYCKEFLEAIVYLSKDNKWHTQLVAHIHFLAVTHQLEKSHRTKNNLGSAEIDIFFRQLFVGLQQVENWKQHYAAWLLVFMASPRPGSFTVCPGYEAGASLGVSGLTRPIDETLRWGDISFFQHESFDGIAVTVPFKYTKNQRNPHTKKMIEATKTFTFLPTRGSRLQFDLSAILLGLAFSRGLFDKKYETIADLHKSEEMFIAHNPTVAKQAVFVQVDQAGKLVVDRAMNEHTLNDKLREMCIMVGLLSHFSMYSLRRSAIIETRRSSGTEFAKELAGHKPYSTAIVSYDNVGLADVDITALRLGEDAGMVSRQTIRDMFSQSRIARFQEPNPTPDPGFTGAATVTPTMTTPSAITSTSQLKNHLEDRAKDTMHADQQYIDIELELSALLNDIAAQLDVDPLPVIASVFETYRGMLRARDLDHSVVVLDEVLKRRKQLRKSLMARCRKEELEKMRQEQQKTLKVSKKKATLPFGGRGLQPEALTSAVKESGAQAALSRDDVGDALQLIDVDEQAGDEDQEDAALDADVVDESEEATRAEPTQWDKLADEVVLRPQGDEDELPVTLQARIDFIARFASLASIPTSNLKCILCALDPSTPPAAKDKLYTRTKLDRHLRSLYHTRKAEIERAVKTSADENKLLACPLCDEEDIKSNAFFKHLKEVHEEWV